MGSVRKTQNTCGRARAEREGERGVRVWTPRAHTPPGKMM